MLRQIFNIIRSRTPTSVVVHTVNVGSGGNSKYDPDTMSASVGDVVMFNFCSSNYSVIRGEYTGSSICGDEGCNPCTPYELSHPGAQGFHSNNMLTQNSNGSNHGFSIIINDTLPIWFYSDALQACHSSGMVGVINPAIGTSVVIQRQAAQKSWPVDGSTASGSRLKSLGHDLSGCANAGVVIGITVFLGMIVTVLYFMLRQRATKQESDPVDQKSVKSSIKYEAEGTEMPPYLSFRSPSPATGQPDLLSPFSPRQGRFQMQGISEFDGKNLRGRKLLR